MNSLAPIEFVIDVLQKLFSYNVERATQLMLKIPLSGKIRIRYL